MKNEEIIEILRNKKIGEIVTLPNGVKLRVEESNQSEFNPCVGCYFFDEKEVPSEECPDMLCNIIDEKIGAPITLIFRKVD